MHRLLHITCLVCVAIACALLLRTDPWEQVNQKAQTDAELLSTLINRPDRIGWRLTEDLSLLRAMLWDAETKVRYPVPKGFTPILYEFSKDEARKLAVIQSELTDYIWEPFDTSGRQLLHCRRSPMICLIYDRPTLEDVIGLPNGKLVSASRDQHMAVFLLLLAGLCGSVGYWLSLGRTQASTTLSIMPDRFSALRGELQINLSARDLKLLMLLNERSGKVVTKDELYDAGWGREYMPNSRALDQHIINLRRKLDPDKSRPVLIETVHGVGYRLVS